MRDLISISFSLGGLTDSLAVQQIVKLNQKSIKYGLILSASDALQLVETRNESLRALGRIEVGSATVGKIIAAFCDSAFINQQDYASLLHELIETFYYYKNETLELISDDELIELMKDYYEHRCRGSMELLKYRELDKLARNLRYGIPNYAEMEEDNLENLEEEDE